MRGRTGNRGNHRRRAAWLVRLAPRLLRGCCIDASGFDEHAASMTMDVGAAMPWTRCFVRRPRAVIVGMNSRGHRLRAVELQRMEVAQESEAEENERKHADHRHQATPDGSGTSGICIEQRKLERHFLILKHLWQALTTSHWAHH